MVPCQPSHKQKDPEFFMTTILDKSYTHVLWVNESGIHSTVEWKLLE